MGYFGIIKMKQEIQYEKNIIFLPQLIQSAETAKIAFSNIIS